MHIRCESLRPLRSGVAAMADCLTDPHPPYTTIVRYRHKYWRYLAVALAYDSASDRYEIVQSWGPLAKPEAIAMAQRWARLTGVDYKGDTS